MSEEITTSFPTEVFFSKAIGPGVIYSISYSLLFSEILISIFSVFSVTSMALPVKNWEILEKKLFLEDLYSRIIFPVANEVKFSAIDSFIKTFEVSIL